MTWVGQELMAVGWGWAWDTRGLFQAPPLCFTLENFHNKNAFLKKVTTETSRLCSQRLTVSARGRCIEGLFAPGRSPTLGPAYTLACVFSPCLLRT